MADTLSLQRSIERQRAIFAYQCAEKGRDIKSKIQIDGQWYEDDKYKSYVQKFPMLVKRNGLANTIAFYYSRRKKEKKGEVPGTEKNPKNAYDLILYQLTEWFKEEPGGILAEAVRNADLVRAVLELNSEEYRALTNEALAFLAWLKRFAEGLIEGEEDEG